MIVIRFLVMISLLLHSIAVGQLVKVEGCKLVETEWADGDSFQVLFPDGKTRTIRLYGVDCMEMHVNGDDSNARRLRDQRRYFGITEILTAKELGKETKEETTKLLSKPFTIHTSFVRWTGRRSFHPHLCLRGNGGWNGSVRNPRFTGTGPCLWSREAVA